MTKKVKEIVWFILDNGSIDGAHHKQWVLDQVLRMLLDEHEYRQTITQFEELDSDGTPMYEWDLGIAP